MKIYVSKSNRSNPRDFSVIRQVMIETRHANKVKDLEDLEVIHYEGGKYVSRVHEADILLVITERKGTDDERVIGKGISLELAAYLKTGKTQAFFADVDEHPHVPGMFNVICERIYPECLKVVDPNDYTRYGTYTRKGGAYDIMSLQSLLPSRPNFSKEQPEERFKYGDIIL